MPEKVTAMWNSPKGQAEYRVLRTKSMIIQAESQKQAIEFAEAATQMGAVRFPQIGRMLNFEMPWDGIILIDRLVKWNTLAGPMC